MRTLVVLPIKSFGAAKTRLGNLLGTGSRRALAQAMSSDVLGALRRARGVDVIAVVTGDPLVQSAAAGSAVTVLPDAHERGQSAAAQIGIRHALESGFDRVLLVPGDTPLLDPAEVDALLARSEESGVEAVIVPDRHGEGTNALLLTPPSALEPSFGPDSLARHRAAAEAAGLNFTVERVPSLEIDVDTPDDFAELGAALLRRHGSAPLTRGALRQLEISRTPHLPAADHAAPAALRA